MKALRALSAAPMAWALALVLAISVLSGRAEAANYAVRDGNGTQLTMCSLTFGSAPLVNLPCHILVDANGNPLGTGSNPLTVNLPAGSNVIGKVGIDQTTPGSTNAVSPQYGASGVSLPSDTISSAAAGTGFSNYIAGREIYTLFKPTSYTGVCYFELSFDAGTTWSTEVVGAGGSNTALNQVTFSASSSPIFVRTSLQILGAKARWDCGAVNGSFGSGSVIVSNFQ